MPSFIVTSPEGKKYRINAPDGSTQEDAINYVRNNFQPPQKVAAPQPRSPISAFLNRGIAELAGTPVDLVQAGIRNVAGTPAFRERPALPEDAGVFERGAQAVARAIPSPVGTIGALLRSVGITGQGDAFGGSESIESAFRDAGIAPREDEVAEGFLENMAQGVGSAAGALLPGLGIARVLSGTRGVAGNIAREGLETAARKPAAFLAAELGSGAGSGAGGELADEIAPGNQSARVVGEVLGGILTPAVGLASPTRLAGDKIIQGAKKVAIPFTKAGARARVEDFVQGLVPDADQAARKLDDPTLSDLTPAQRIGEDKLLELEAAVAAGDPKAAQQLRQRGQRASEQLEGEMSGIRGEGRVEDLQTQLSGRQEKLTDLLDQRIQKATDAVEQKMRKIKGENKQAMASRIAREELDKAYNDMNLKETELWNKVPQEALVEQSNIKSVYKGTLDDAARVDKDDIPKDIIDNLFNKEKGKVLDPNITALRESILGKQGGNINETSTDTVKEMIRARGKLLEDARIAGSEGRKNRARVSQDLAEAIMADLTDAGRRIGGDTAKLIDDARAFSKVKNDMFSRSEVGKVLKTTKEGGDKVAEDLTLERIIGSGGVKGNVGLEDMLRAADTPELRGSIESFIKDEFTSKAIKGDVLNTSAARKFVEDNKDILDKFPQLRKDIEGVAKSTDKLKLSGQKVKKALTEQSKSAISKLINAPIDKEFSVIMNSKNPAKFIKDLANRASKDKTGQSTAGLKAAAIDHVMKKSTKSGGVVGDDLLKNINKDRALRDALSEVLSPDEMQRLRKIGGELKALQKSTKAAGAIINDNPSKLLETFLQVHGANIGASLGKGAGSLQTANIFSNRVKGLFRKITKDKAEEILKQAVQDPDLMKALLTSRTTVSGKKLADQRLEAWLLGPGANLLDDEQE